MSFVVGIIPYIRSLRKYKGPLLVENKNEPMEDVEQGVSVESTTEDTMSSVSITAKALPEPSTEQACTETSASTSRDRT